MAESKRTFQAAKIERDLDERLIQPGAYRDALNVSVASSEDANVGSLENLKGNEILANQEILGLSSSSNPNASVIGSYAHPEENKIYYFITGDKTDGIFEYNADNGEVSTIIVDSSEENVIRLNDFTFADAGASGTIAQNGKITLSANLGTISPITPDPIANLTAFAISTQVNVKVKVPSGYNNSGGFVFGAVTAVQGALTAPASIQTKPAINMTTTSATLRGLSGFNDVGLTSVGFYWGYNVAGTQLSISELQNGGTDITRNTISITSAFDIDFSSNISGLPAGKLISFVAFGANSVGTGTGAIKTFTTTAAAPYNNLPDNKIFIFPTVGDNFASTYYYPGYGEFEKPDGSFYLAAVAAHSSGLHADYGDISTGTAFSNTGPATLSFTDLNTQFAKTYSASTNPTTNGVYTITASKSGFTSGTTQIVKGSPSGTRYKSTFSLNFAKTGTGTVPFVAVFDHSDNTAVHWNDGTIAPLATFSIGPFEQGQDGVIMIPLSTDNTVVHTGGGTTGEFNGSVFDPASVDVSITGKTEGTDYNYYIATEAMSVWGGGGLTKRCPAIIVEADPYVLNGGTANVTHTLNITYNY